MSLIVAHLLSYHKRCMYICVFANYWALISERAERRASWKCDSQSDDDYHHQEFEWVCVMERLPHNIIQVDPFEFHSEKPDRLLQRKFSKATRYEDKFMMIVNSKSTLYWTVPIWKFLQIFKSNQGVTEKLLSNWKEVVTCLDYHSTLIPL